MFAVTSVLTPIAADAEVDIAIGKERRASVLERVTLIMDLFDSGRDMLLLETPRTRRAPCISRWRRGRSPNRFQQITAVSNYPRLGHLQVVTIDLELGTDDVCVPETFCVARAVTTERCGEHLCPADRPASMHRQRTTGG